ncbi:MAG: hypothetical protein ACPGQS_09870 [Bradymonadia bacterium]
MYRACSKISLYLVLGISSFGWAAPKTRTAKKPAKTKVRKACDSLRRLAKQHPPVRERAKMALFHKREAERICRDGFKSEFPGAQIQPLHGSVCKALAQHQPQTKALAEIVKRAGLINRQADMRCVRVLKRLKAPKTRPKLRGNE